MPEFYQMSVEETLRSLQTSLNGLTEEEASKRLHQYGKNAIELEKKINVWKMIIGQFTELLVLILIGAGILSYWVGDPIDTIAIFAIVILNGLLGFLQEYKAEKAIEELKKLSALNARVKRNGQWKETNAQELVPGDIVQLEEGDKIPADIRFIETIETAVDEAILTGESNSVSKTSEPIQGTKTVGDRLNTGYANTSIVRGRGTGVVTGTGLQTEFGKIAQKLEEVEEPMTPLKQNMELLAKQLTIGVLGVIIILFIIGFFFQGRSFVEMFLVAIALGVAAIPEGLPAITTITLALGIQKMAKRNALIKHLPSAETLGSTTVICSDKTGTLTKNEMTVEYIYADGKLIHVTGVGYSPRGELVYDHETIIPRDEENGLTLTLETGVHCNNAQYDPQTEKIVGDPTEGCLLVVGHKARISSALSRVKEIPFTSERKMMSTIHQMNSTTFRVFTKGAVERVLEKSAFISSENGKKKPLTPTQKQRFLEQAETLSQSAYRVLAFAYRDIQSVQGEMEQNLIVTGLMALRDPPREEVREALQKCQDAGIQVKMITGDHPITAKAIAQKLGMHGEVITGLELNQFSPQELAEAVRTHTIFARVDPEHKYKIVERLQTMGHVVAVTGDGVNDAPAIKKADIGIAMGIKGTDVAKEASAMVLRDDNFATIVNAVELGRTIYQNLQGFVRYLLGANFMEVLVVSFGFFLQLGEVVTPIQLLWINLATDALPALALGEDPPSPNVMKQKPRPKTEKVLNRMGSFILVSGIIGLIAILGTYYYGLPKGMEYAQTMAFTTIVVYELVLVFNARQEGKSWFEVSPFSNSWLVLAVLASFGLQVLAVYAPFLDPVFGTKEISLEDWGVIALAGLSAMLVPYVNKIWLHLTHPPNGTAKPPWPVPKISTN